MEAFWADLTATNRTVAFALLILGNVIIGALAAMKDGRFTLSELAGVFDKKLLTLVAAYAGVNITGANIGGTEGEAIATGGSLVAAAPFIGSVIKYIIKLVGKTPPAYLG